MKIKKLFLLFIIFSFTLIIPKSLNLRDSSSVFKISSCSNLILDKTMNSITGKVIKDSGAQISGENMEFEDGSFQDSGSKINITGKLNFGQTQKILLDGGKTFLGKRGEVFQDIFISGTDNLIEGVLFLTSDIEFQDRDSKASFDLRNRLDVDIKLNNGSIILYEDLCFLDSKRVFGPGKVTLNGYQLSFGSKDLTWNEKILFENASNIDINSSIYLEDCWSFSGDSILCGNSNVLCIDCSDGIVVRPKTNLLIRDTILYGLSDTKIRCMTDDATITLKNVKWIQDSDFTFTRGSLIFLDNVEFIGNGKKFIYQSKMTSTISLGSTLKLDRGFTFSYAPISQAKDLIFFESRDSKIFLNSSTLYADKCGLELINGSFLLDGVVSLESKGTTTNDGIVIGNQNENNDFLCLFFNGCILKLKNGSFSYKNKNINSFDMRDQYSRLSIASGATLNLYEDINLNNGMLIGYDNTTLARIIDKRIIGSVSALGNINYSILRE